MVNIASCEAWSMEQGAWSMEHGAGGMENGAWGRGHGARSVFRLLIVSFVPPFETIVVKKIHSHETKSYDF